VSSANATPPTSPARQSTTRAPWPPTAADALAALDTAYARWTAGVVALDADRLAAPVGPAEGPWAELPFAALVLHINRETIHHLAEVLLLRDLYRARQA